MLKLQNWNPLATTIICILLLGSISAFAGDTEIASTTASGQQGDKGSREPSISADGRLVCFESNSSNLVPGDTNDLYDVFVKDMLTGKIIRVSISSSGRQGNKASKMGIISADGSTVAFMSRASNLVPNDTNDAWDYFVHDLRSRKTTRVSVSSEGTEGNGGANCDCRVYKFPGISVDGQIISFQSDASNLVPNDTNGVFDIFRHDRRNGETVRVSLSTDGQQADDQCWIRDMSLDGRFIVWHSPATNLVPNDTNGQRDIFINDFQTGITERINIPAGGGEANDVSDSPRVSAGGRFVTYASKATNLIPNDTNNHWDVFLRDRLLGETSRISISSTGEEGNFLARHPSISANGRWITYHSISTNLVPGDTNNVRDIFLYDRLLQETIRVSLANDGTQPNEESHDGFITPDGAWVVYDTYADNLVTDDNNERRDIFRVKRFDRNLTLSNPLPGKTGTTNVWAVKEAAPGASITLLYGTQSGQGQHMTGCPRSINITNPRLIDTKLVDEHGEVVINMFVGNRAAGKTLFFQAYEPISCRKTNIVEFTFP